MKTPVTILSGYLGAGKTTLVNHLLRQADGRRLAIMVNEFGELPIDADLIEAQGDDIISLAGGCVCCSYGNDLMMAMMELAKMNPRPDHIVLEASGVALPGAIFNSLTLLADYSVDGVIVLADAETVEARSSDKFMADTVLRQLHDADIVLLNKSDLVSAQALQKTSIWLGERAPNGVVIATSRARIPVEIILQNFDRQGPEHGEPHRPGEPHRHGEPHRPGEPHRVSGLSTHHIYPQGGVSPAQFTQNLIDRTPGLVRAKGFVRDASNQLHTIQIVGRRFDISPAPPASQEGVVVICVGQS